MTSPLSFNFFLPTEIVFGAGRLSELGARLSPEFHRVLLVTDKNVASRGPAVDLARRFLGSRDIRVFPDVVENPTLENIEDGSRKAKEFGAQAVLGVGGGSSMDAAKGIALLAENPGPLLRYLKGENPRRHPLPIVCVPTTSGTGSETTPYAVFTDLEARDKLGYSLPGLFPVFSIVDPTLAYTMPEEVALNTGLDVLSHAAESFLSTIASPLNDALALHVIDEVIAHLEAAIGKDPKAMDRMSYAATLAGIAITHGGTILPHIMGYPLTVFHGIPHGRASAVLLPPVLAFLREKSSVPDKVRAFENRFSAFGGVANFIESFGVPLRLSSYGVREDDIGDYVQRTIVKSDVKITPAEVTESDLYSIYRSAL
jgi:alcohol dehydrogenase class IV